VKPTRIITRPDFDGVVCAVLLKEALGVQIPVLWVQPGEMQAGNVQVGTGDIVANLPLHGEVGLWFDHHVSNAVTVPFKGVYRVAPSAAGLVQDYFEAQLGRRFDALVRQTDRIDAADLTLDEILHPERYPFVLLSMTTFIRNPADGAYCDRVVELLRTLPMQRVMADASVRLRCEAVVATNKMYEACLTDHTSMRGHISVTDLRGLPSVPDGNRFLVYSLFPDGVVNVKISNEGPYTLVKLGHSILNRGCRVNVGRLLSQYGGGGHVGAGACRFEPQDAQKGIDEILTVLERNEP